MRYSMQNIEVKGPGKIVRKVHSIVTILDEKGDDEAGIALPYNRKFATVGSFEMIVYDANGKQIKKYHKGDMYDHAVSDDEALLSDDRSLSIGYTVSGYPTTVEMVYEIDQNSIMNLDQWDVQGEDQSIQNSYYNITITNSAGLRYLDKNILLKPQKNALDDNTVTYSWHASSLKAIKMEDGAMSWRVLPKVEFAMNKFEYYGLPVRFQFHNPREDQW